jgi:hypothetical protein
MKKIYLLLFMLIGATSSYAYDKATAGTQYYGQSFGAYGLEDGTVAISEYYTDTETDIVFPATIQIWTTEEPYTMTAEYEVSQIGYQGWDFYFSGSKKLADITSITVPEGIKIINGNFWGATALTKLVLPSTLTDISKEYGFGGATALTRIECKATTPPTLAADLFAWDIFSGKTCSALVPDGAAAAYNTEDWTYWKEMYDNSLVYEATYPSITTAGYTTYYNTYGYVMPEGVEGYLINWTNEGTANLAKVYDAGDEVYAGLALIWKSTEDLADTKYFTVEALSSGGATATWPQDGEGHDYKTLLNGSQTAATTTYWGSESSDYYYYKLANGTNGLGWYWGATEGAAFESGAHKAWMFIDKSSSARGFIRMFNEPTGVNEVTVKKEDVKGTYYDLSGRRVMNPTKGLYIVNGKKILK